MLVIAVNDATRSWLEALESTHFYRAGDYRMVDYVPDRGYMADFDFASSVSVILDFPKSDFNDDLFLKRLDYLCSVTDSSMVAVRHRFVVGGNGALVPDTVCYTLFVTAPIIKPNGWFYYWFVSQFQAENHTPLIRYVDDVVLGVFHCACCVKGTLADDLKDCHFFGHYRLDSFSVALLEVFEEGER